MQLTENVYLVGGGPFTGFGLTSHSDCHVYLVDGGSELALIDSGLGIPAGFDELTANIEALGFDPGAVTMLALTHYHADHAGGAARARRRFGAAVAVAAEAAPAIEAGDEVATGLRAAREAGVFPEEAVLEPCPVDRPLREGDTIPVGTGSLRYIPTPGHARGHGSFLLTGLGRRALFTGDALFWAGRILLQAVPDCDLQESIASVERLAALDFDAFLPGHGAVTVAGGSLHPALAKGEIERLGIPKGIL
jgi:glyoxylase-like metal-dependent hydrolase (beta-lactamase superfamily II)